MSFPVPQLLLTQANHVISMSSNIYSCLNEANIFCILINKINITRYIR